MPLTIISRRNITYRESGRGEMTVLLVPGRDQIQVVKDLAGLGSSQVSANKEGATVKGAAQPRKQVQLSRVYIGRRFIYGTLPQEINDLRQPVKIWLAEDFAPVQSQAFFYIISNTVVIHGVREQDDEGFHVWRTAQLPIDATDPLLSIINAISDYALANPTDSLTVAVLNKLDLYEKLQQGLSTYNISPVPFSKLKPPPNLKPLYRHRDYTVLYLTLAFFGFIGLLACIVYAFLTYLSLGKLEDEVANIQRRIDEIKLNQNVGLITDPQAVLQAMTRSINQQPSAIVDAAGSVAAHLGDLDSITAVFTPGQDNGGKPLEPGQINVITKIANLNQELLLMQERVAKNALENRPWVREIRRIGAVGKSGELIITLQVDQAPGSAPLAPAAVDPAAVAAVTPTLDISATAEANVSATEEISPTVAPAPEESVSATTKGEGQ